MIVDVQHCFFSLSLTSFQGPAGVAGPAGPAGARGGQV